MSDETIFSLDKGINQLAEIGLSLEEGKTILAGLQRPIIEAQIAGYMRQHGDCPHCHRRLWRKGSYSVAFRTLYGTVTLASPRLYRCPCRPGESKTFSPLAALLSEHTSPELLYLESKWASLVSFGVTVDLLKDVLPIDRANISTVRRHLNKIAARAEAELVCEPACWSQGSSDFRLGGADLVVIGIDGGYVRNWHAKKRRFEVVVGKSMVSRFSYFTFYFVIIFHPSFFQFFSSYSLHDYLDCLNPSSFFLSSAPVPQTFAPALPDLARTVRCAGEVGEGRGEIAN